MSDREWMFRALELAERGQGAVEPNPMVGCVLVQADQVIAEGWHRRFGDQHAEVDALEKCSADPKGATAYVTLEPCCHFGKQPPCTQSLIRAGIKRVVVAMADPFAEVDGGGISQLEAAGIKVEVGLLEERARYLNAPYLKLVQSGQPWLIAKWAATMDGKIATS
ncbi:MAG: bifunctional diaminohydroxyphosphoribosylaminopyrimidine deaminase/5-amino-6-(5-phosphoribosylamino)uracil reductase RibD, partial [Planctomycetota bacterium]|nr:bifunctional diaminohydroxyphosphoribosylaminopyrimidine deaminase/5-amino-6-(5-phosphoribosylamino)uracil reductase RibD [Planctomycetota bacterium]